MGYLDDTGNTCVGQISHKAMEIGARVSTVGADIISDIKQVVKPQSPKKIVSKGQNFFKTESRGKGPKLLANIMPVMALLANLTTEAKREEDDKPVREHLQLEETESSAKINVVVLMDKETRRSCIGEQEFRQLGIPRSKLRKGGGTMFIPRGTKMESLGIINLKVPCRCDKKGCQTQVVQFDVMQGLLEQGII